MATHTSKSYKLRNIHKRDDVEHLHPKKENLQYQNQTHRVYHKF